MGYLSNVRFRLEKDKYEELVNKFEEERQKDTAKMSDLFEKDEQTNWIDLIHREEKATAYDEDYKGTEVDTVYFGWNGLKWYRGYKDVDLIMNFVYSQDHFAYSRIGEESGDTDVEAQGFEELWTYSAFENDD